jgi:hypothetical protein
MTSNKLLEKFESQLFITLRRFQDTKGNVRPDIINYVWDCTKKELNVDDNVEGLERLDRKVEEAFNKDVKENVARTKAIESMKGIVAMLRAQMDMSVDEATKLIADCFCGEPSYNQLHTLEYVRKELERK